MLYAVLDNGEFLTLVEGAPDQPMLDFMREHDEMSTKDLTDFLVDQKEFKRVRYNVIETVQPPTEIEMQNATEELSVLLDDGELMMVVRGKPASKLYDYVAEFFDGDTTGSLNEYLTSKGFEILDDRGELAVFDGVDAFGAMRYAQTGLRQKFRVFTN